MENIVRAYMGGRWPIQKEGELEDNISAQTMSLPPPPPSYADIEPSFHVPKQVAHVDNKNCLLSQTDQNIAVFLALPSFLWEHLILTSSQMLEGYSLLGGNVLGAQWAALSCIQLLSVAFQFEWDKHAILNSVL